MVPDWSAHIENIVAGLTVVYITTRANSTHKMVTTFIHARLVFISTNQRYKTKLISVMELPLVVNVLAVRGEKTHSTKVSFVGEVHFPMLPDCRMRWPLGKLR